MLTLGINISHDFSVCLWEDKKIKNFYYENRLRLDKYWDVSKNSNNNLLNFLCLHKFKNCIIENLIIAALPRYLFHETNKIIDVIKKQINFENIYFDYYEHHLYHALCGYFFSSFNEANCVVIDGCGSLDKNYHGFKEIESVYFVDKKIVFPLFKKYSNNVYTNNLKTFFKKKEDHYEFLLKKNNFLFKINDVCEKEYCAEISLGAKFELMSEILNFEINEAGKLMGLAAYHDKNYENINNNFSQAANKLQKDSLDYTIALIEKIKKLNDCKNFVLSGGYFLNCSNNFKLVKKFKDINFFVDPNPTDAGTAIGACVFYDNYK
jgi:predicted NodU family carbamoyl transferase